MPCRTMHPYGNSFFSWLFPIILIFLIGLALYMIFRKNRKENARPEEKEKRNPTDSALTILNERYAKGDIDQEEYHRIKK
ncbi:MAG: SHOCT domain-containing protein, partial [Atopostipes suicloacalis]|nr:SHOCT domain-containing protein [Atopostipes suicloacalis]